MTYTVLSGKLKLNSTIPYHTMTWTPLSSSKVKDQGHRGGGILWRPPAYSLFNVQATLSEICSTSWFVRASGLWQSNIPAKLAITPQW